MISRRHRVAAPCVVVTMMAASSATAQTSPEPAARDSSGVETPPPALAAPATRSVIFSPDRAEAQLEFRGVGFVDGIWKEGWIPVCTGPCAGSVPLAPRYRVSGPGIHASRSFEIGTGSQPLRLDVQTGSASRALVGTMATIFGGVALGGGLLFAGMAGLCGVSDEPGACDSRATAQAVSLVVAAAGGVALLVGILQLTGSRTVVSGDEPPRRPP